MLFFVVVVHVGVVHFVVVVDPRNLHLKVIKIGSGTAEILRTLSLCGGWAGLVVCKVIFKSNPTIVLMLGWGFDNYFL